MRFRLYIEADYQVPDDDAAREDAYGSADLDECVKVDEANDPIDMLEGATVTHHRIRVLDEYSTPGNPAELDEDDLIMAMGVHDQDCPCAYCAEWRKRRAVAFTRWVLSLDRPGEDGEGVTWPQIVEKAREALALPEEE